MNTSDETECALNRKSESINIQIVDLFSSNLVSLRPVRDSVCAHVKLFPNGFISIDDWIQLTFPIVGSIISSIVPLLFTLIAHSAFDIDLRLESEVVLESCNSEVTTGLRKVRVALDL